MVDTDLITLIGSIASVFTLAAFTSTGGFSSTGAANGTLLGTALVVVFLVKKPPLG